uniref:AT-hook motif nuclear-localized protein n=2 Tax=Manihot esculenta TaxID=3983 RepID=A0A2C9V1R2_MANES
MAREAADACMEDKDMISTTSQQSPVTIKHDPQVTGVVDDEEKEPNFGGGSGDSGGGGAIVAGSGGGSVIVEMTGKRKRGRPKKFDMDSEIISPLPSPPPGFPSSLSRTFEKRGRGRPRGSGRLQLLASLGSFAAETAGGSFIPHVVPVNTGEDIVSKISSFAERGSRAICILSATGVVSSVVIRQPGLSGGILRYEGRFEILSLCGSFTFDETSGANGKTGMLSVSLAKPDGRVFGGGIVGSLIASGPIQLIVASFKQNICKELKLRQLAESAAAAGCVLGNSEKVRSSFEIAGTIEGEGHCTSPTSPHSEQTNGTEAFTADPQNIFAQVEPPLDSRNEDL